MHQCRTIRILLHVAGHNRVDSGFWPLLTDRMATQKHSVLKVSAPSCQLQLQLLAQPPPVLPGMLVCCT